MLMCLIILGLVCSFWIWFPMLIITWPIWSCGLFLFISVIWLLGLSSKTTGRICRLHDWLLYTSDKPREFFWKTFYDAMVIIFPQTDWKCMNYGYAAETDSGHSIVLDTEEEAERFAYQMYHYVCTGMKKFPNLGGLFVVEVGSGRGGGLAFVEKYLKPSQLIGIDNSVRQIKFCSELYKSNRMAFRYGDAERLPIEDESTDLLFSIETTHAFRKLPLFLKEATRVLKTGGYLIIADYLIDKRTFENYLFESGLKIFNSQDITPNVQKAISLENARHTMAAANGIHSWITRNCEISLGGCVYMVYHLVKNKS